jgi:hypothetical protein
MKNCYFWSNFNHVADFLSGRLGVQVLEKLCSELFWKVRIEPAKSSETFPPRQDGTEALAFAKKLNAGSQ